MCKADQPKTAFTTPFGLFQFCVMPFGLKGALATFQRLMDKLLRGLESYAAAYLDDLIIYSTTWDQHLAHIRSVLERLQSAGLTARPRKCQFTMQQCVYLGHVVGRLKENNSRLSRWSLPLQPYQFQVRYHPGQLNSNADALSRA